MTAYIIKRLFISIPVLFGILLVTFVLARLIPGDPCKAILGEKATVEVCEKFKIRFGLDKPIHTQFMLYSKRVVVGDFGNSIRFSRPVSQILVERFPVTIELALGGLVVAIIVGVFLGIISALRHNSPIDVGTMVLANIGISMPVFWLGLMLAYLFGLLLKDTIFWLPPSGRLTAGLSSIPFFEVWGWEVVKGTTNSKVLEFFANHYIFNALITGNWEIFKDSIRHMILPVIALSTIPMAIIARITRSSLLEVLGRDYIRTARAKGLSNRSVLLKHALPNAMNPVVTAASGWFASMLAGAVFVEYIFGWNGLGKEIVHALNYLDLPVVMGAVLTLSFCFVLITILVDFLYYFLDPKLRG